MKNVSKRLALVFISIVAFCLVVGWLALFSSAFAERRASLVESVIADGIGQSTSITGDVIIDLWPMPVLRIDRIVISGGGPDELNLAELPSAKLTLDVPKLLKGKVDFSNIEADGLQINLVTKTNGQKTWIRDETEKGQRKRLILDHEITEYLIQRNVQFSNFFLNISNELTGFEFKGKIDQFEINYSTENTLSRAYGHGTINSLPMSLEGKYSLDTGATKLTFGAVEASFQSSLLSGDTLGYSGALEIKAEAFHDIFDLLKLKSKMQGTGALSATVSRSPGVFSMTALEAHVDLESGGSLALAGEIQNLLKFSGIDLDLKAQLESANLVNPLSFGDPTLALSAISSEITGSAAEIKLKNIEVEVNSKERGVESFGPFSIGKIERNPDNTLSLSNLDWRIQTARDTSVAVHGEIEDLLNLQSYLLSAKGSVSVADAMEEAFDLPFNEQGHLNIDMQISDPARVPAVDWLRIASKSDTEFELKAEASVGNLLELDKLDYSLKFQTDSFGSLFTKLEGFTPYDKPVEFISDGKLNDAVFDTQTDATIGRSDLAADLSVDISNDQPKIGGSVSSEILDLKGLGLFWDSAIYPFDSGSSLSIATSSEVQSLEVEQGQDRLQIPGMPAVQPLVIGHSPNLIGSPLRKFFSTASAQIAASVKTLSGVPSLKSIQSDISLADGKLSVAPINVNALGSSAKVSIEVDVIQSPDIARLTGSVYGWTLSDLANLVKWDVEASGKVSTTFDLFGNYSSVDSFLGSANGQISVRLRDGKLGSSILKLAGYGVFPWLFSQELSQGFSDVSCIFAPLRLKHGKITVQKATLETQTTQLVIDGQIDLTADALNLTGEPRPLGMPFEPSPYPFKVTGSLKEPSFDLLPSIPRVGTKRLRIVNRQPCVSDRRQVKGR